MTLTTPVIACGRRCLTIRLMSAMATSLSDLILSKTHHITANNPLLLAPSLWNLHKAVE